MGTGVEFYLAAIATGALVAKGRLKHKLQVLILMLLTSRQLYRQYNIKRKHSRI